MKAARPVRYTLRIEPDLVRFCFSGRIEIELESGRPVDHVILNILELAVWSCTLKVNGNTLLCSFQVDPKKEELRIDFPRTAEGVFFLVIEYQGWINEKMAGFYRSTYKDNDEIRFIAVTQFQESDARRALPCMDHPSEKAVFEVEMIVAEDLAALSNGPMESEEALSGGKRRVRFKPTPPMSTYLLFFGVGAFHIQTDKTDPRVRSVILPGREHYDRFGLDFGRKALHFCETYYRIPYALDKMDLIAVPDFAFGAMENWGAITFRENLILHYPGATSRSGEMSICNVIAHEIAHQWFGNLVTPSDWKYLWLNESFATFFAYGVVDHYHPEWQIWDQFLLGQTASAMRRDGLTDTCAIEIPGGEHVVINTSTAPIIYSKGSSILRLVQEYIGREDMRKGLEHYLKTFEYSNAASHHLWEALEAVSGKPVTALMKCWIEQPGHPLIQARREGRILTLTQKRFTYLEKTSDQTWLVPITISAYSESGGPRMISIFLEKQSTQVDLGADTLAYKINAGQTGFYRVSYQTPEDLSAVGRWVADNALSPEDRWGLQNDLFAQVQSGTAAMEDYLAFLDYYQNEDAYLPLSSIADNLFQAYLIFNDSRRKAIRSIGRSMLEKTLVRIGHLPLSEEPVTTSLLRDQILLHAVIYGAGTATDFLNNRFKALFEGEAVHPDILKSVLMAGAMAGGEDTLKWLIHRFESCHSEHERIEILTAMGCFQDPDLVCEALEYALEEVPVRNRFVPIVSASANPRAADAMWEWFKGHIDSLEMLHPLLYERVIAGIVPVSGLSNPDDVKEFFRWYLEQKPHLKAVVQMSLERLEIHHRMRHAESSRLKAER
ncbi:MAG: M1 family metallopeptidase [Desulfobacterales bacterium]